MIEYNSWSDIFSYDESSPSCLKWKVPVISGKGTYKIKAGDIAGSPNGRLRWSVQVNGKLHQCHRVIYEMFNGPLGELSVDHIDGNPENNLISNLRAVSHEVNMRNCKFNKNNKSGHKGVYSRRRGKYLSVVVTWSEGGKKFSKEFAAKDETLEEVIKLASEYRASKLKEINSLLGEDGYTDRHIGGNFE